MAINLNHGYGNILNLTICKMLIWVRVLIGVADYNNDDNIDDNGDDHIDLEGPLGSYKEYIR